MDSEKDGRWYLGAMNDALFIIDQPPRPSNDDVVHERGGAAIAPGVVGAEREDYAKKIVDAHNAVVAALRRQLAEHDGGWDRRAADRLADEVAALVRRGKLDSRSPAADALLDYRNPPSSPRADRLAELEQQLAEQGDQRAPGDLRERLAHLLYARDAVRLGWPDGDQWDRLVPALRASWLTDADTVLAVLPPAVPDEQRAALRARAEATEGRPQIVCLCGSTRFWEAFRDEGLRLSMESKIVLSIGIAAPYAMVLAHPDSDEGKAQKAALDVLHKHKIDMADEVRVLNVGAYVGDSTKGEIRHALIRGKPITWLEPDSAADILKALTLPAVVAALRDAE